MRSRVLDGGREIIENQQCPFDGGTIDVKDAVKAFKNDHSILARMEQKEAWIKKSASLNENIKQQRLTVYEFFFEDWKLNEEYSNQKFSEVPSSLNEEIKAECNKCSKPAYYRVLVDIEAPESTTLQTRDLVDLKLGNEAVIRRVASRMRFEKYDDFQKWCDGPDLKKAAAIIKETTQKLNQLKEEDEVNRLIGVMAEIPAFLEEKLRQRRFDLLQEVKKQLFVDKPHIGEIS